MEHNYIHIMASRILYAEIRMTLQLVQLLQCIAFCDLIQEKICSYLCIKEPAEGFQFWAN